MDGENRGGDVGGRGLHERLLYVSQAAPGLGGAEGRTEVYRIIRSAHLRNGAEEMTGALVWLDGWFAQLLEGPAPAVAAVWGRLLADPRHRQVRLRLRERALARLFPGQLMALRTAACLEPQLLEAFGYRPGFPADALPADALVELLVRACQARQPRTGPARVAALDKARRAF